MPRKSSAVFDDPFEDRYAALTKRSKWHIVRGPGTARPSSYDTYCDEELKQKRLLLRPLSEPLAESRICTKCSQYLKRIAESVAEGNRRADVLREFSIERQRKLQRKMAAQLAVRPGHAIGHELVDGFVEEHPTLKKSPTASARRKP